MNLKTISALSLIALLAGCSSATMEKNFEDAKFAMKDDFAKFTSIVYDHQFYDDAKLSPTIVKLCKIKKGGMDQDEFENFAKFNPKQAKECFDMLVKYKDPRFNQKGSKDQKAHEGFHAKVNFYTQYYFH